MKPEQAVEQPMSVVESSIYGLYADFLAHLPFLLAGLVALLLTWALSRIVGWALNRILSRSALKRGLKDLVLQLSSIFIWLVGLMITAIILFPGMTPTKALAGLGVGSLAIGFAFKDIVENFLAGILILWRFPFDPGDFIRWGDVEGKVEDVTIRMTLIRRTDGELVVLPNAKLFTDAVNVLTSRPERRITVMAGVGYDEDIDESRKIIRKAVEACDTVSKSHPVEIFANAFGASSVDFEVTWWAGSTPLDIRSSRDQVIAAVKKALDDAGIEIPYPYRTLTFKESLSVSNS